MKLDVTTSETPQGFVFLIDGKKYNESAFNNSKEAFEEGLNKVQKIRASQKSTLYLTALRFATEDEKTFIDSYTDDELEIIASRKYQE